MCKRILSIILTLLCISGWNSYVFAESAAMSAYASTTSTSQQMMDDHCDHASDTSNSVSMGCLEHCAAIYMLPASYQPDILRLAEILEPTSPSFKLIPESFNHWRPPSTVS